MLYRLFLTYSRRSVNKFSQKYFEKTNINDLFDNELFEFDNDSEIYYELFYID